MYLLIAYLLGILTGTKKHPECDLITNKSRQEDTQSQYSPVVAYAPPALTDEERTKKENEERRNQRKFRLEIAGFIVLSVYTFFTAITYWQIRKSAEVATRQFRTEQRAWLNYDWPNTSIFQQQSRESTAHKIGDAIETIKIANSGKTPAREIEGDFVARMVPIEQEVTFDLDVDEEKDDVLHTFLIRGVLFPNDSFTTNVRVHKTVNGQSDYVTEDDFRKGIDSGTHYMVFYGRIKYSDIFGVFHWSRFCTGGAGITVTTKPESRSLRKCMEYNEVDTKQ